MYFIMIYYVFYLIFWTNKELLVSLNRNSYSYLKTNHYSLFLPFPLSLSLSVLCLSIAALLYNHRNGLQSLLPLSSNSYGLRQSPHLVRGRRCSHQCVQGARDSGLGGESGMPWHGLAAGQSRRRACQGSCRDAAAFDIVP